MKSLFLFLGILFFSSHSAAEQGLAPTGRPIQEEEVREILRIYGVGETANKWIVGLLEKHFEMFEVSAVLSARGFNAGFMADNDTWELDGFFVGRNGLTRVKGLFDAEYHNGGFKAELVYKAFWVFLFGGMGLNQLDGAVFHGTALGSTLLTGSPVGAEAALLGRGDKFGPTALIVAIKFGAMEGTFLRWGRRKGMWTLPFPAILAPRLEFKQKKVLPWALSRN